MLFIDKTVTCTDLGKQEHKNNLNDHQKYKMLLDLPKCGCVINTFLYTTADNYENILAKNVENL